MGQLLLVVFAVAVLLIAPLKVAAFLFGGLLLATLVVQATATRVGRTPITMGESLNALVMGTILSIVATLAVWSFLSDVGWRSLIQAGPGAKRVALAWFYGLVAWAAQYGGYFVGFRLALGLPFLHSAIVAVISSIILSICWWLALRLMT